MPAGSNSLNPIPSLIANRYLISQLVRREVLLRYRGSALGIGWSFFYPLLLLFAFTLVFGGVFGGRWGEGNGGKSGFEMALFIYCGLAVFTPFSEVITNTPRLLLAHQNFVKKIIFPTEILPLVSMLAASIHAVANLLLLVIGALLAGHNHLTLLILPVVLLPVWLITLGFAWFLTAAGAYVRDLAHGVPVLAQLLMFILPVFYPSSAAPGILQAVNSINPLATAMEDLRRVILLGQSPLWSAWIQMLAVGIACSLVGYAFFLHCKEEFADVL